MCKSTSCTIWYILTLILKFLVASYISNYKAEQNFNEHFDDILSDHRCTWLFKIHFFFKLVKDNTFGRCSCGWARCSYLTSKCWQQAVRFTYNCFLQREHMKAAFEQQLYDRDRNMHFYFSFCNQKFNQRHITTS